MSINQNDEIVGYIYKTSDFSKFKHLDGNRSDALRRAPKIMKSISKHGYIPGIPVLIDENGGIWEGQARVEACKELKVPICYTVCNGLESSAFIDINISQTGWRLKDYIDGYADQGMDEYILLKQLLEKFPKFRAVEICGIAGNRIILNGFAANSIKEGRFAITKEQYSKTEETLEYLSSFLPCISEINGQQRAIRTAIAWVVNNTNCDKTRLREVITKKYPKINPVCESVICRFLENLSELYNQKIGVKKQIDFDAEYKLFLRLQKDS